MIIDEFYRTREDGVDLNIAYSDQGFYIKEGEAKYESAIYPTELHKTFVETDEKIPERDEEINEENVEAAN